MAEMDKEEFKFPDEQENEQVEAQADDKFEVEIEDDTPEEDRGRETVSPEAVKKLEVETDELDQYSKDAKDKLIKMKRVWHDERRAKEQAYREQQEALTLAKRLMAENERIKKMLQTGEAEYKEAKKDSAEAQLKAAKQSYKEAYDAGDAEKLAEAQQEMTKAQLNLEKVEKFKLPPLQEDNFDVQTQYQAPQPPQPDRKVMEWQNRNPWFGQDEEMTAAALGLHEKLKRNGVVVGSDEYYETLDKTIRKRFAENFEHEVEDEPKQVKEKVAEPARTKPSTVVAPATRSTAPNRIRLKTSQVLLAKKLGLTPEQYALELRKLEAQNG
jgi:hypothetical protein